MVDPLCKNLDGSGNPIPFPDGPNKVRYSPEISGGLLPNMPSVDFPIVERSTVTFTYVPPVGDATVLELRNPELNDLALFQSYRVQKYSRGDTLIVFRDPTWFKTRVFNWSFTGLTRKNRNDIIDFVNLSAGKYIDVVDYWSRTFRGIIINPDNPITQEFPDYDQQPTIPPASPTPLKGMGYTWKVDLQKALI